MFSIRYRCFPFLNNSERLLTSADLKAILMFLAPAGIMTSFIPPTFEVTLSTNDRLFCRHLEPSPPQTPHSSSWTGESMIYKKKKNCSYHNSNNKSNIVILLFIIHIFSWIILEWTTSLFSLFETPTSKFIILYINTLTPKPRFQSVNQVFKFVPCHNRAECIFPARRCCWGCRRSRQCRQWRSLRSGSTP
jgi:hypothetical protein